jgi:hypothetical protein
VKCSRPGGSGRLLSWLCAIAAAALAALMWLNLAGSATCSIRTRDRMFAARRDRDRGGVIFSASGSRTWAPRRTISAAILSTTMVVSVAAPIVARGRPANPSVPPRHPATEARAASDAHIAHADARRRVARVIFSAAAGRLPTSAALSTRARAALATLRPTRPKPVWSAIATGRYPM